MKRERHEKEAPFHPWTGIARWAQLSNKRGDLGFVTAGRQIRYVEEGSLARTFVESRRILNCLPRNVALSPARHRDIGNLLIHFAEF